ncbi:MAG: type IV-A pilus assembly ATPase PilB [SAR86 cluster bacterium]|uniref:Type IV-A pilus assembly ATPase PilB n=1 Tax=SAR86 cluster bacterium TaxID=2030880 RepID=A0A2A5CB71_9GAMM|nr:MAG: type IV-A pilus assembly ATPase PilB [SAR86 cluster bacterium]
MSTELKSEIEIKGLAKKLVAINLIAQGEMLRAYSQAREENIPLTRYLVKNNILDSKAIAETASIEFGLPRIDLAALDPVTLGEPVKLVNAKLIKKHNVLPLQKKGNRVSLAVSDPSDENAINEIKFNTGASIDLIIVEDDKLQSLINELLDLGGEGEDVEEGNYEYQGLDNLDLEEIDIEIIEESAEEDPAEGIDDTPIVKFVNKVLLDAIKLGVSDIHIEPYEKVYRVRYRLDGILKEIARPPINIANRICSRIKIMAKLDISERRLPQDGRIKMKLSRNKSIDFRVNTLPTLWGEKIVMRILDSSSVMLGIDALGYEDDQKQLFLKALHQHQGLILVTGPTGSGKTVSLYTGLNILNTNERNISTAEDPVEINLEGINQVAINARVGLDFASALRAFLRQDPDVVMVGEIRDLETAEIAIKASQTGHMVLSTLHTNSASETLSRMMNMGIASYNLATSVTLIIAQRLARRLCNNCKKPIKLPPKILLQEGFTEEQLENIELYGAMGCDKCNEGYKGRVGIYEVVPITDSISRIIMDNGNTIQIADMARQQGFNDLRNSALIKVAKGLTSLAEANRIT